MNAPILSATAYKGGIIAVCVDGTIWQMTFERGSSINGGYVWRFIGRAS